MASEGPLDERMDEATAGGTLNVVFDYPPIFDEIDAKFHVRGKKVIFCWGNTIYNPMRIGVPPVLIAHEAVHKAQQKDDIVGWWRRYIDDDEFRFQQELPAHVAEYYALKGGSRNERRAALKQTAQRLASPLYGRMITPGKAAKLILAC